MGLSQVFCDYRRRDQVLHVDITEETAASREPGPAFKPELELTPVGRAYLGEAC